MVSRLGDWSFGRLGKLLIPPIYQITKQLTLSSCHFVILSLKM